MNRSHMAGALILGQLVGLLGWIDATYVIFVLAAPPITGAIAAHRGWSAWLVVALWASAGLNMTWVDYLVNREDVAFHLVLCVVMALLAALGHSLVRGARRLRGAMVT